jgi:hypothetical protein
MNDQTGSDEDSCVAAAGISETNQASMILETRLAVSSVKDSDR